MELQITSYYSPQGFAHALTIYNFYKEYSPRFQLLSLRYLYSNENKGKNAGYRLRKSELDARALQMFETFLEQNNIQQIRELADLLNQFSPEIGQEVLDRVRLAEEVREIKEQRAERRVERIHATQATQVMQAKPKQKKIVYQDSQNVHNSKINKDVITVAQNLCDYFQDIVYIANSSQENDNHQNICIENLRQYLVKAHTSSESLINDIVLFVRENIATFGNSVKNTITLKTVFIALCVWIGQHEHREDLEKRLLEEMQGMKGQCTTGHLSRFINVLQGYTSDETLLIKISIQDQANAVIRTYLNKELSICQDDKILEGIVDKTDEYATFLRNCITRKLKEWIKDYGKEILEFIPEIVNNFADMEILVK